MQRTDYDFDVVSGPSRPPRPPAPAETPPKGEAAPAPVGGEQKEET